MALPEILLPPGQAGQQPGVQGVPRPGTCLQTWYPALHGASACWDTPETHSNYRAPLICPRDFLYELVSPVKNEIQDNKLSLRAQMSLIMVLSSPSGLVTPNEFQLTSWMNYRWRSVCTQ